MKTHQIIINQSKLQQWQQLLKNQLLLITQTHPFEESNNNEEEEQQKEEKYRTQRRENINQKAEIGKITLPKPSSQLTQNSTLCQIQNTQLSLFQYHPSTINLPNPWKHTTYHFPPALLKPYSSITHIPLTNQIIIIGGSKPTNPNIKSSKILSFNILKSKIQTLTHLPYGLSSHSTLYHQLTNTIFIIGGNKNHSIVSRGCFRLWIQNRKVQEISCLNYPVSSSACVLWKNQWIYKFGGIGQAFGEWNTSPYIERYSIEHNEWQVINPSIGPDINQNIPLNNMFLAFSVAYVCDDPSKIFVFGGYSIDGHFKKHGFLLKILQSQSAQQEDSNDHGHIIDEYGTIQTGASNPKVNKIAFVKNERDQTCLFGLIQLQESSHYQPILIHSFLT